MVATCPTCGTINAKYDRQAASHSGMLPSNMMGYVTWMYETDSEDSVVFWDFGEGEKAEEFKTWRAAEAVYKELDEQFFNLIRS